MGFDDSMTIGGLAMKKFLIVERIRVFSSFGIMAFKLRLTIASRIPHGACSESNICPTEVHSIS